jgi:hypothetical protein
MLRLSSDIGRSELNLWNYLKNISLQTGNILIQIVINYEIYSKNLKHVLNSFNPIKSTVDAIGDISFTLRNSAF